jgi:hypothetical protein
MPCFDTHAAQMLPWLAIPPGAKNIFGNKIEGGLVLHNSGTGNK